MSSLMDTKAHLSSRLQSNRQSGVAFPIVMTAAKKECTYGIARVTQGHWTEYPQNRKYVDIT